jgi:glutamyl-tRNA synthetase
MVEYYERLGYLPAGVLNALGRLGWSLDDKTEYFSREDLIAGFTLDRIVKKPAGFDADKLASYQAHWMGQLSLEEKLAGCRPFVDAMVERESWVIPSEETLPQLIAALGDRLKVFSDILDYPEFFVSDEKLVRDEKAFRQRVIDAPEAKAILSGFVAACPSAEPFNIAACEQWLHQFAEAQGLKLGQIVHAIRLSVTGRPAGVGLAETLALLGRERCLVRLNEALGHVA